MPLVALVKPKVSVIAAVVGRFFRLIWKMSSEVHWKNGKTGSSWGGLSSQKLFGLSNVLMLAFLMFEIVSLAGGSPPPPPLATKNNKVNGTLCPIVLDFRH